MGIRFFLISMFPSASEASFGAFITDSVILDGKIVLYAELFFTFQKMDTWAERSEPCCMSMGSVRHLRCPFSDGFIMYGNQDKDVNWLFNRSCL